MVNRFRTILVRLKPYSLVESIRDRKMFEITYLN